MKLLKSLLSVAFIGSVFVSANVHADAAQRIASRKTKIVQAEERIKQLKGGIWADELRIKNVAALDAAVKAAESESNVVKKCDKIGVAQKLYRTTHKSGKPAKAPFDGKGPSYSDRLKAEREKVKKMAGGANCAAIKDILEVVQEAEVNEDDAQ